MIGKALSNISKMPSSKCSSGPDNEQASNMPPHSFSYSSPSPFSSSSSSSPSLLLFPTYSLIFNRASICSPTWLQIHAPASASQVLRSQMTGIYSSYLCHTLACPSHSFPGQVNTSIILFPRLFPSLMVIGISLLSILSHSL